LKTSSTKGALFDSPQGRGVVKGRKRGEVTFFPEERERLKKSKGLEGRNKLLLDPRKREGKVWEHFVYRTGSMRRISEMIAAAGGEEIPLGTAQYPIWGERRCMSSRNEAGGTSRQIPRLESVQGISAKRLAPSERAIVKTRGLWPRWGKEDLSRGGTPLHPFL